MSGGKSATLSWDEYVALRECIRAYRDSVRESEDDQKQLLRMLGVPARYRDEPDKRAVSSQWAHTEEILAARERAGNPYVRASEIPNPDEPDATHLFLSRLGTVQ